MIFVHYNALIKDRALKSIFLIMIKADKLSIKIRMASNISFKAAIFP